MDYGIVLVTIQYRLGLFGFLSTGDLECPGNNGFKDQQFALRWIQANIHNFGGDPTKVTISGESAGSASVGYQLLGTNSKGLFRGAIQASGSPLGSWSLQRDPKGNAYKIANYIDSKINETNTSTKDLVNLFRTLDVPLVKKIGDALYNKEPSILAFNSYEGFIYMGVIEPEHDGAFLTENAFKKFASGDFNLVPTLIGTTSEESLNLVNVSQIQEILSRYDASPDLIVTPSMHLLDQNIKIEVGKEIKRFYVGERLFNESQGPSLKFMSDAGFGRSIIKQAQMQAVYSDVYFYEFGYSGDVMRLVKSVEYIPEAGSVGHVEDEAYVFLEISEDPEKYSRRDLLTINRMVLLWTNFVKYLNPTPEPDDILQNIILPKLSKDSFPYLAINDTLEVKYDLKKSMMEKFDRLFDLYALSPLDTY
ncbi:hypothetical protein WA026_016319 [Henosepilachna vigintioctopunctata]|uniref:Carboxylic ester hydrolase n=1 Tax=Henosepilachna vigintioctopunctata TaxID=420089 RepID=A0AAW1ULQ5_9CUCU